MNKFIYIILLLFSIPSFTFATDIIEVLPLTNKIILVRFDDGDVDYETDVLTVNRLDEDAAEMLSSYLISSTDDANFTGGVQPMSIGRRTRGTEFLRDPPGYLNDVQSYDPRGKPWASEHWIYLELTDPLQNGSTYTINTTTLAANGNTYNFTFDEKMLRSEAVHVNTVGYAPEAPKYGYVYHWLGDKGGLDLSAYNGNTFWVYEVNDLTTPVETGNLKFRKSATNQETTQIGDTPNQNFLLADVYECEFTDITADGEYILVVEDIGRSFPFKIGTDAVLEAAYATGRALYYQRSGIRLAPPFTEPGYIRPVNQNPLVTSDDGTDYSDMVLYSDFPFTSWADANSGGASIPDIKAAATGNIINVAGWYHDAGDWDSYHQHHKIPSTLMLAYEYAPERFADNELNIPESGNGIPDIIDEASWLIKFNYRLRKELMAEGYSDGGVGGARVCADPYNSELGNPEEDRPSWQEFRPTVVTQADAFMTYYYAGQAAHFAYVLNRLGKDNTSFPVELLDDVDFANMTYDNVNWVQEAIDAYAWAADPNNQPASNNNYEDDLTYYQLYAAANLFRLTGDVTYKNVAEPLLQGLQGSNGISDIRELGVYSYILSDQLETDPALVQSMIRVAENNADFAGVNAAEERSARWGGIFSFPMILGHGTTPLVFENVIAYGITGDDTYRDVVHQTADYFLGNNPEHTTWMSGVGPREIETTFHLDSRYIDPSDGWVTYPGYIPYGPTNPETYAYDPIVFEIDGVEKEGGKGPFSKDWHRFSVYPLGDEWPGHQTYSYNIHAPQNSENTIHQNTVYANVVYNFANSRAYANATAANSISTITLNQTMITLNAVGAMETLIATLDIDDATFAQLIWESAEPRIAHVNGTGVVTAVNAGTTIITVSTLDGSVSAQCTVNCNFPETPVTGITVNPSTLDLIVGQDQLLEVVFAPRDATNTFVDWTYSTPGIVEVDEDTNVLTALAPGTVTVTATSLNGGFQDDLVVTVVAAEEYVIVNSDDEDKTPSTAVSATKPRYYQPGGVFTPVVANPLVSTANPSANASKFNRNAGTFQLFGLALPTDELQELSTFKQFQFKYYSDQITGFYIQLNMQDGSQIDATIPAQGENAWKLFTFDIDSDAVLETINIFPNSTASASFEMFFDDFTLVPDEAVYYEDLSLTPVQLELDLGTTATIVASADGNPFTFLSDDESIATVDQAGEVTAVAIGQTTIRAVPLYGDNASSIVTVVLGNTVEIVPQSITILPGDLELNIGAEVTLTVEFDPANTTFKAIEWTYSAPDIVVVDPNTNVLTALNPGTVQVTATTTESSVQQSDMITVTVLPAQDFVVANFDEKVPSPIGISPDVAQIYFSGGGNIDIDASNPLISDPNPSATVVDFLRPTGTFQLVGFFMPTDSFPELERYEQFQFKYYGEELNSFFVQLVLDDDTQINETATVVGENCWKLFTIDLSSATGTVTNVNIFPNQNDDASFSSLYDDIQFVVEPAVYYTGLSLQSSVINVDVNGTADVMASTDSNPVSYLSADPSIATVDQSGQITGVALGQTTIRVVPLYGDAVEATVNVLDLGDDATLSNLTYDGITVPDFDPQTFAYTIILPQGTSTAPTVVGTPTNPNAQVQVMNMTTFPGVTSVTVTSADGTTTNTYEITFGVITSVSAVALANAWTTGSSHTVGTGDDLLLVYVLSSEGDINSVASEVTYGGQSMTSIGESVTNFGFGDIPANKVSIWYLREADLMMATDENFVVTFTGTGTPPVFAEAAVTLENVDQDVVITDVVDAGETGSLDPGPFTMSVDPALMTDEDELVIYATSVDIPINAMHQSDYTEAVDQFEEFFNLAQHIAYKQIPSASSNFNRLATSESPVITFSGNSFRRSLLAVGFANAFEAVLPVELIDFSAKVTAEQSVQIDWQTASEVNNEFFTVERSKDSKVWEGVAKVAGANNSLEKIAYSVLDEQPLKGVSYYRLKQTDFDGTFAYSAIEAVRIETKGTTSDVLLYPNPFNQEITLEGTVEELGTIAVYDLLGRRVTEFVEWTTQNGGTKVQLDLSRLDANIYILKTKTSVHRMMKQ